MEYFYLLLFLRGVFELPFSRSDSVTWNPHKLMSVPVQCSVLLVKEQVILYTTFVHSKSLTEMIYKSMHLY